MPILHERRRGVDRRRNDHGGYQGFDRRVCGDQRMRRARRASLSDAEWSRYLEMPDLLEMWVDVPADLRTHFEERKRREGK